MTPLGQARAEPDADDATVIQLSRHEPEQFTVLFRRHAPYIQRYVVRRLGDPVCEPFTDRVDDRVSAALAGLPAGLRDTLLLAAWSNLTYEEIAIALGVPVGTVRSRLSRARARLRRTLGDADPSALTEEPQS